MKNFDADFYSRGELQLKRILISTSSYGMESNEPLNLMRSAGFEYILNPFNRKLTEEELQVLLQKYEPEYLIAGTEIISRKTLKLAKTFLRIISRCGTGIDNVDIEAAKEMGIRVTNTPDAPTRAVAELTIGVLLDLLRGISKADTAMREGKFDKKMGNLLYGKTVGLIGCGRIGTAVSELLHAFGCRVIGYDSFIKTHKTIEMVTFNILLERADIISLHIPYSEENEHIINRTVIEKMRESLIILNVSRGGLIDEDALYDALVSGRIKAAGLDCFEQEPYYGKLIESSKVVLTPHIGSYAIEARIEQEIAAVKNILNAN